MDEALHDAMERRRRFNEEMAVLILDIDRFKQINDRYGHPFGDEVLRWVARSVVSSVREVDHVFRMGGEEFVVLLTDTDRARTIETAERIRTAIAVKPCTAQDQSVPVTVSIGVAVARDETDGAPLLAAADAALYRAKHEGRNRVC